MQLRQPRSELSEDSPKVEFGEIDVAKSLARQLLHNDGGPQLALNLYATERVNEWRGNAARGALAEHPRLPFVRQGSAMRDLQDQGRSALEGDVVDLVLLPRDDPA